jgi:hypothetical protein
MLTGPVRRVWNCSDLEANVLIGGIQMFPNKGSFDKGHIFLLLSGGVNATKRAKNDLRNSPRELRNGH